MRTSIPCLPSLNCGISTHEENHLELCYEHSTRLCKQFFYNNNPEYQEGLLANTMALEPRMVIWDCALKIVDSHSLGLRGNGFTQTNEDMLACYQNDIDNPVKKSWFLTKKYNVHNQFLDLYLGSGIFALILFAAGFLLVFWRHRRALYPTSLMLSAVIFLMAENVFHRQLGAYYMGLIWALLMFMPWSGPREKIDNPAKD